MDKTQKHSNHMRERAHTLKSSLACMNNDDKPHATSLNPYSVRTECTSRHLVNRQALKALKRLDESRDQVNMLVLKSMEHQLTTYVYDITDTYP